LKIVIPVDILFFFLMQEIIIDLGSRLDTLDDIETEKNCPYPQIASLLLNSYHLEVVIVSLNL